MDKRINAGLLGVAAAGFCAGLGGCGGSGGSSGPVSIGGFFSGTVNNHKQSALITEDGKGWLFDDNSTRGYALDLDINSGVASGTVRVYDESTGAFLIAGTVGGTVGTSGADLTFTLDDSTNAIYALTSEPIEYKLGSSLSDVAGNYSVQEVSAAGTVTGVLTLNIDASGNMTGEDPDCTYTGTIMPVDPDFNGYQIDNFTQICGDTSQSGMSGPAILSQFNNAPSILEFAVANSGFQLFEPLIAVAAAPGTVVSK